MPQERGEMNPPAGPPYIPAPYLSKNSLLTTSQLVSNFQDFYANLEYVSCAPALVFDRLVTSLSEAFNTILEQERLQHASILEQARRKHDSVLEQELLQHTTAIAKSHDENKALQLSNEKLNNELSELKEKMTNTRTEVGPTIRTFYTHEVRSMQKPCDNTSNLVTFPAPYSAPPKVSVGLNMLDFSNGNTIRVKAHAKNIRADQLDINIGTWTGTIVRASGCTWLEMEANDPDFQFGYFYTGDDHHWTKPEIHHTRQINFSRVYAAPPKVVVWLQLLDLDSRVNWRVKAYETDVTTTGFTIHIDTWGDSVLYNVTASWVAYPADKPNICSGKFSTNDIRPAERPQLFNSAYVSFGDTFTSPPRTLLALNSLEIDRKHDLRLAVKASDINASGMTWHLDSWDDTILYSAGASYIALA